MVNNILWSHWLKYYLPSISYREKWIERKLPLKVGDVIMTLDTQVANTWRIGRILEIHPGSKGQA